MRWFQWLAWIWMLGLVATCYTIAKVMLCERAEHLYAEGRLESSVPYSSFPFVRGRSRRSTQ